MNDLSHIKKNIDQIRAEMATAATNAGRDPDSVRLIAVTKTYPAEFVTAAVHAGVTHAGENKVQEAAPKIDALANDLSLSQLKWHLIGHLQSNKAKLAVQYFDLIHSVDSLKLAQELDKHAASAGRHMGVLIQVNVSGEESKGGVDASEAQTLIQQILDKCHHVQIRGFMTMAPFGEPEDSRPSFRGLRELRDRMLNSFNDERFSPLELSMGMSNDYKVAIEEGSTMVRIGTAIFGQRD